MTDVDPPWWSSGVAPGSTAAPGPAADDRARREEERQRFERARAEHERSGSTGRSGPGPGPGHDHDPGATDPTGVPPSHDGDVCQVCPICTALRLVGEVRPDLFVHLAEAARHLTLAAKTVVDAHAAGFRDGLEHIPLDDDVQ